MDSTKYIITFKVPLKEQEEHLLIGHVQNMIAEEERVLRTLTKRMGHQLLQGVMNQVSPSTLNLFKVQIDALLIEVDNHTRFYWMFELDHHGPNSYYLIVPSMNMLKGIPQAKVLFENEGVVLNFIHRTVKDMGKKKEDYDVKVEEVKELSPKPSPKDSNVASR